MLIVKAMCISHCCLAPCKSVTNYGPLTASRQVPPGQVPLWTSSSLDNFPPDKFPFGQVPPGQVPLEGKHLKRTTSPRTTSTSDKFPPGGSCPGGSCPGGTCPGGSCPGGTCLLAARNPAYFCSKVTKDKGLQMVREALRKTDVPEEVKN